MKKRMNNMVLILMMTISVMSYANSVYSLDTKKGNTVLTLNNVKEGHELIIKDTNLLVLYRESIQQNGTYKKGFDLTALPDGDYYFELDKDVEIVIIPFKVTSNTVVFDKEKESIIYKPTVRVDDNHLFVSRLSLDVQPLKIKIYYRESFTHENSMIFSEEIENTKIVERIYELSKQKKGEYTVMFESQGRSFTERIKF
ncbi:hypothetical protein [Kordia sp.]|uniref:hypothetical protein n=1 Tax=Kordia sp. TaxID=1965332 RepID=UPI003B5B75CF